MFFLFIYFYYFDYAVNINKVVGLNLQTKLRASVSVVY